jgi:hypothetical protein
MDSAPSRSKWDKVGLSLLAPILPEGQNLASEAIGTESLVRRYWKLRERDGVSAPGVEESLTCGDV